MLAIAAGSARADTYCVNTPGCDVPHDKGADLQQALDAAAARPGPDTVKIGNGTVTSSTGFTYDDPDPVHIDGSGGRSTGVAGPTLEATAPSPGTPLAVLGAAGSTISDIAVEVEGGNANTGIDTVAPIDDVL